MHEVVNQCDQPAEGESVRGSNINLPSVQAGKRGLRDCRYPSITTLLRFRHLILCLTFQDMMGRLLGDKRHSVSSLETLSCISIGVTTLSLLLLNCMAFLIACSSFVVICHGIMLTSCGDCGSGVLTSLALVPWTNISCPASPPTMAAIAAPLSAMPSAAAPDFMRRRVPRLYDSDGTEVFLARFFPTVVVELESESEEDEESCRGIRRRTLDRKEECVVSWDWLDSDVWEGEVMRLSSSLPRRRELSEIEIDVRSSPVSVGSDPFLRQGGFTHRSFK